MPSVNPEAPPVNEFQLSAINRVASPMPMVAMAKYGPRNLKAGGPIRIEYTPATRPPTGKVSKSGQPASARIAVA